MKLHAGDWLWNASLVGYLRIQKARFDNGNGGPWERYEEELEKEDCIDIQTEDMEGFANAYFMSVYTKYFIDDVLAIPQSSVLKNTDSKSRSDFINEFKAHFDVSVFSKCLDFNNLSKIMCSQIDSVSSSFEQSNFAKAKLKKLTKDLNKLRNNLESSSAKYIVDKLKRFYFNQSVIGNYSLRKTSRIEIFNEQYVTPAKKALSEDSSKGMICRFCKQNHLEASKMTDYNESFFGEGMFSTSAVTLNSRNFFYFLQPDLIMCKLCRMLLICSWAGFNNVPWNLREKPELSQRKPADFVFVTLPSLQLTFEENSDIETLYQSSKIDTKETIYETIIGSLLVKEKSLKSKWTLQNILFIELQTVSAKKDAKTHVYYFSIPTDIATMFAKDDVSIISLNSLANSYIRNRVVHALLLSESLHPLSYSMLKNYIDSTMNYSTSDCVKTIGQHRMFYKIDSSFS